MKGASVMPDALLVLVGVAVMINALSVATEPVLVLASGGGLCFW